MYDSVLSFTPQPPFSANGSESFPLSAVRLSVLLIPMHGYRLSEHAC